MKSSIRQQELGSVVLVLVAAVPWLAGCRRAAEPAEPPSQVVEAMNRGVSSMGQYLYEDAVRAFQEVLAVEPELKEAKVNLAIALFNRAQREDRDLERTGALLDEVLAADPDHLRALYFKGIFLQHVGDAEGAIPCFERVVRARPRDGAAWYLLGLCKQRLGQPAEAELLRAVEVRPYLYSAYYKLSQIALGNGQADQAQQYLDQFKRLRESPLGESIELPQYNQMGDLALAQPLPARPRPPIAKSRYQPGKRQVLLSLPAQAVAGSGVWASPEHLSGVATGDVNGDGRVDLVIPVPGSDSAGRVILMLGDPAGGFREATAGSGLESVAGASSCAVGDYDNDENLDVFIACAGPNSLFRGRGDGTFEDVTQAAGVDGGAVVSDSALFLDADHDADLDILVCNVGWQGSPSPAPNQLWNNNADGTFKDLAANTALGAEEAVTTGVLCGDLDGDRDLDLVLLRRGGSVLVLQNDLLGQFRPVAAIPPIAADLGGVLQDFNGDSLADLLALGGDPAVPALVLGDGQGGFRAAPGFDAVAGSVATWGRLRGLRAADVDLDGDLDVVLFGEAGHALLNDGTGQFVLDPNVWSASREGRLLGAALLDVTGDFIPDLLCLEQREALELSLTPGTLAPPSTGLAVAPTGIRGRDKRTRSPSTGYGVTLTLRSGLREQVRIHTGVNGGFDQSAVPAVFGLGGAAHADYLHLLWPDGVAQVEIALAAGTEHKVSEIQRKISSCPVLFSWNGERFEFVTDFAGVGGLGYFVAPGEHAFPQILEHVKIEPEQLRERQGHYELRVAEPMEEVAYVDRLELRAVDHPAGHLVFPDERLAIGGLAPTHELLVIERPEFPRRALDPDGRDCADRVRRADRVYAYEPRLDRRFIGFCPPHTFELDFGEALGEMAAGDRIFLFIQGFIEYPFSQTVYAASQARVGWEPIRLEGRTRDGAWKTLIPDAGVPGGMNRMMTVELTGLVHGLDGHLRLTTNLEVYYDQIFLGRHAGRGSVAVHALPVAQAELRRLGFPREFSPDGRQPMIYDYDWVEATAPFHLLRGAYTRYGPVEELLEGFDDRYVLVGPGDEIAVRFDATRLPPLGDGWRRSFVLVSHAYCKDMDLYTATPETIEPLPFQSMSRYPYPATEQYPDTPECRAYLEAYNTRVVE